MSVTCSHWLNTSTPEKKHIEWWLMIENTNSQQYHDLLNNVCLPNFMNKHKFVRRETVQSWSKCRAVYNFTSTYIPYDTLISLWETYPGLEMSVSVPVPNGHIYGNRTFKLTEMGIAAMKNFMSAESATQTYMPPWHDVYSVMRHS